MSQLFCPRERFPFSHLDASGVSKQLGGTVRPTGVNSVLQKLSSLVRHCLEGAVQASERAAESRDTIERRDFHPLEDNRNMVARSRDFTERFGALACEPAERRPDASTVNGGRNPSGQATIPGKQLISIVEDDTGVGASLKRFILSLGYASCTFARAEEYLESGLLRETACLICDVQLPGMSGPDLQARLIADGHRIPIVLVTGCFNETIRARVLTAGAVGYFAKPFDPRALIGCLEKALAGIPS
jgi:CheY-like chemotaxis protein